MKAKSQLLFFLVLFSVISLIGASHAQAVCPVCTLAVAGGLGVSRWLGVDDFVASIWIGGLALSVTIWGWNFLKKKGKLTGVTIVLVLALVYLSILIPLYRYDYVGIAQNTLWGYDKILFGIAAGTVAFWLGAFFHSLLKKRNDGQVYVKLQKVLVPVAFLLILSGGYYVYCKCYNIF